ncbi:MAG: RNA polymerase sigma factor [Bacteroidota bacterium]
MENKDSIGSISNIRRHLVGPEKIFVSNEKNDESIIWGNFQNGNEEALIFIYRKYAPILYNYGCQFTHDHEYIWDCIQDLFCELIRNRRKMSKVTSIKGYLFKSTKRKIFKGLKKINKTVLTDANDKLFEVSITDGITPISQMPGQDRNKVIEEFINELPPHQREVLLLHFYEGMTYQEIADAFEVKVKSIRTMTYRALEKLSRLFNANKDRLLTLTFGILLKIF